MPTNPEGSTPRNGPCRKTVNCTLGDHTGSCNSGGMTWEEFGRKMAEPAPAATSQWIPEQSSALSRIPRPRLKHQIDEIIKGYMATYFGWHGSAEWVDKPYEAHDIDADGRPTGPGKWRALRRFAKEVRELSGEPAPPLTYCTICGGAMRSRLVCEACGSTPGPVDALTIDSLRRELEGMRNKGIPIGWYREYWHGWQDCLDAVLERLKP